jgi:ubiquinone/menaquinone biosynthesis C-methylase UbiE
MKARDSGMPEEQMWASFFDAPRMLAALGFVDTNGNVADFGCGYGTFTVAAAGLTTATVFAFDIEPAMIEVTAHKARSLGLRNVRAVHRDLLELGSGLADASLSYAMLFNILHAEQPLVLLREVFRTLAPGGKVAVVHWIYDSSTPRGPHLSIRPRPEHCRDWLKESGFELAIPLVSLPPYHYGVVGRKPIDTPETNSKQMRNV